MFFAHELKARGLIYNGRHLPYNPQLVERAKQLRKNMTFAEKKLWKKFFKNFPLRVLRQRPIDHFIVDFYIAKLKLVIEIDGEIHEKTENIEYDKQRSLFLDVYGLKIVALTMTRLSTHSRMFAKKSIATLTISINKPFPVFFSLT